MHVPRVAAAFVLLIDRTEIIATPNTTSTLYMYVSWNCHCFSLVQTYSVVCNTWWFPLLQVFIFMLMWFQFYSGFSGGTFLDDFNLILFNLVFTSLPPIMFGVLEKDVCAEALMAQPRLYKQGHTDWVSTDSTGRNPGQEFGKSLWCFMVHSCQVLDMYTWYSFNRKYKVFEIWCSYFSGV